MTAKQIQALLAKAPGSQYSVNENTALSYIRNIQGARDNIALWQNQLAALNTETLSPEEYLPPVTTQQ